MSKNLLLVSVFFICRTTQAQNLLESNSSRIKGAIVNQSVGNNFLYKTEALRDTINLKMSSLDFSFIERQLDSIDLVRYNERKERMKKIEEEIRTTTNRKLKDSLQKENTKMLAEGPTDTLQRQLVKLNAERITLKIKSDSTILTPAYVAMQKVQLNARKLSNYTWDFDKFLKDTTKEAPEFIAFFNAVIALRTEIDNKLINDIDKHFMAIRDIQDKYEGIKKKYHDIAAVEPKKVMESIKTTDIEFPEFENSIGAITKEIYEDTAWFSKQQKTWDTMIIKYIKDRAVKKDETKINISGLPFFNVLPNAKDINGSMSIFGNNLLRDTSGLYSEVGAFIGLVGVKDQKNIQNIIIPESSSYGFFWKMTLGLAPTFNPQIKKFGINAFVYYLGKSFKTDTLSKTDAINTSQFHGKFGMEYLLAKNAFSVYANINAFSIISNKEVFDKAFNNTKDLKGFIDFGFRFLLNPSNQGSFGNFKLYMDLNFIVNGGDIKAMSGTTDAIIPNIRVGVRTSFGNL